MHVFLDTPGTRLSRENALFEIRYKNEFQRLSPEKVTGFFISKGVSVSTDALLLALQNSIEVVLLDYSGKPKGRLWNNKFGSIAGIRRNQMRYSQSSAGLEWVKNRLLLKISMQLAYLYQVAYSQVQEEAMNRIKKSLGEIEKISEKIKKHQHQPGQNLAATMRGWEGTASKHYFRGISLALPEMYRFETRSRRPAKDIFNCALNYLYGILYAAVEGALIKAGIDPSIGIWHADEYNKPVLSYDFIEPYRVWADAIAFRLCHSFSLGLADTQALKDGIWLAGSGKKILATSFNEYMEEVVPFNQRRRSRFTHIQLDAHEFAQILLNFKPGK